MRFVDGPPDRGDALTRLTEEELRVLRAVGVDPEPGPLAFGLASLPPAPDPDLPELLLAGFLTTPQPDLETEGGP